MTTKELITALEKHNREYGDSPVAVRDEKQTRNLIQVSHSHANASGEVFVIDTYTTL